MASLVALVSTKPRVAPYVNQDPGGLGAFKRRPLPDPAGTPRGFERLFMVRVQFGKDV